MSSSATSLVLSIFYFVILVFAISDLKRFVFHVHIARVDRVPVTIGDDSSSSSLWYPITVGLVFNIFILICTSFNLFVLLYRQHLSQRLSLSTLILFILFTSRLIINLILTKVQNGRSTPTLVERSFLAVSLSFGEEITTLILDWLIKLIGFLSTFVFCYRQKQVQPMSVERRNETKLMSSFD